MSDPNFFEQNNQAQNGTAPNYQPPSTQGYAPPAYPQPPSDAVPNYQPPPAQGYAPPVYPQPPNNAYYGQQPVVVNVAPQKKEVVPGKSKATASMVLGIVSLVVAIFGSVISSILYMTYVGALVAWIIPIVPFVCGVIGLVLGILARKEMPKGQNGMATAGLICSAVSLVLQVLMGLAVIACFGLGMLACAGAMNSSGYSY